MKKLRRLLLSSTVIVICCIFSFHSPGLAKEEFPTGPITLLIGFPPGGPVDPVARILAELIGKDLGQRVLVASKEGMSGGIMIDYLCRQKPDGYIIGIMFAVAVVSNPYITKVDYSYKDLTYLLGIGRQLHGVSVRKDAPWKTFNELVEYAKKNPGKVRYATYSPVSTTSFVMRLIAKERQLDWIHVPYKGDGPAITAILGGHIDALATSSGQAPYVASGQLRLLTVFNKNRSKEFPDVPTIYELGYKVPYLSDRTTLHGVVAPKGLTGEPFERLVAAFKKATRDPAFINVMQQLSQPIEIMEPHEFEKEIAETYEEFGKIYPPLVKEVQK
jgi:tripartite-type tricarboxylate transporter receptor subunit TctC